MHTVILSERTSSISAPVPQTAPVIQGTVTPTSPLTVTTPGTYTPTPDSLTYQWQRRTPGGAWTNIVGETTSSYNVPAVDNWGSFRVIENGVNATGPSDDNPSNELFSTLPVAGATAWWHLHNDSVLNASAQPAATGEQVATWSDGIGSNDWVQAVVANQPVYQTNGLYSSGGNVHMANALVLPQPYTLFVVAQPEQTIITITIVDSATGDATCRNGRHVAQVRLRAGTTSMAGAAWIDPATDKAVLTYVGAGANSLSQYNATASGTSDAGANGFATGMNLFRRNNNSDQLVGHIGEVALYPSALIAGDRTSVVNYLLDKHSITP